MTELHGWGQFLRNRRLVRGRFDWFPDAYHQYTPKGYPIAQLGF